MGVSNRPRARSKSVSAIRQRLPFTAPPFLSCSHVDNVAAAHVQALAALMQGGASSPLAGQAYFIGSSFSSTDVPRFTYGQFNGLPQNEGDLSKLDHWGHPRPRVLPLTLVNTLARVNEALFGKCLD